MSSERAEWLPVGWEVRAARTDDEPQLRDVEQRARAPLGEARGGAAWLRENPPVAAAWSSRIAEGAVLVATIDGVVVGLVEIDGPDERGVARVKQVYVEPDARGVGFGDMLLAAAIDRARETGATTLDGEALPGDRETKNLYERAGITARKITVSTTL